MNRNRMTEVFTKLSFFRLCGRPADAGLQCRFYPRPITIEKKKTRVVYTYIVILFLLDFCYKSVLYCALRNTPLRRPLTPLLLQPVYQIHRLLYTFCTRSVSHVVVSLSIATSFPPICIALHRYTRTCLNTHIFIIILYYFRFLPPRP